TLPTPDELRRMSGREPGVISPTSQMRAVRELEPPSTEEGLATVEHVRFERVPPPGRTHAAVFVAARVLEAPGWKRALADVAPNAPHLVFDWIPEGDPGALDELTASVAHVVAGPAESMVCPHPSGPPRCWCRPPLPGLPLAFARSYTVDPSTSVVVGAGPAHRTLARALGARYVAH